MKKITEGWPPKLTNRNAFSNCDIPNKQNGITYPTPRMDRLNN